MMKRRNFRMVAPQRPRAVAIARVRGIPDCAGLTWWIAALALALALGIGSARAQTHVQVATPGQSTAEYVQQSAMTDLFEITSSRVALEKSQSPAVRDFAQQMMSDHGRSTGQLKQALKNGKVLLTVPTSLDPQHEQELTMLQQKPADQFDRAYLQSQIKGHRNALDTQRAYAQSGDNTVLKQFATQASSRVQGDLAKLETLAQQAMIARMCAVTARPAHPEG
jgi:putative membrane protein